MATGQTPFEDVFPPFPKGYEMPFWYASLQSFWLYYTVPISLLKKRMSVIPGAERLAPAVFSAGDSATFGLASMDFQVYTGHGGQFLETVREVEFNIYVYPTAREPIVPEMTIQQYLAGEDQTKTIGGLRLHVPCDNPNAVAAGQGLFGEPKYLAQFEYSTPTLNDPSVLTWGYSVYQDVKGAQGPLIWTVAADFTASAKGFANPSPLPEYGILNESGVNRVVQNQWTFYGPFDHYLFFTQKPNVQITYGTQPDPTGTLSDLELIIGQSKPIAAQMFTSAPVSSETRAWYEVPK